MTIYKNLNSLFLLILIISVLSGCTTNTKNQEISENNPKNNDIVKNECPIEIKEEIVSGNSLHGLIENGSTVRIYYGFYKCNEVERGDLVIYNYAGNKNPLIKIAKGMPDDNFHLEQNDNIWHIKINNQILKNSENIPYALDSRAHRMLSLYENEYKGIMPQNTYLIMGNLVGGSTDSSRFGLISKNDILGKAEEVK